MCRRDPFPLPFPTPPFPVPCAVSLLTGESWAGASEDDSAGVCTPLDPPGWI